MAGCDHTREQLSGRLDGEQGTADFGDYAAVDAHLATCADCRQWYDDAAAVTRMARTSPAPPSVDVTEAVLAAAPGPGRARLALALRLLLGALGMAQLVLALTQLTALGPESPGAHHAMFTGATPGHLWHESAAWNAAIGAGFLWVAARRGRPTGVLVILSAFVGLLLLLNIGDLSAGRVELTHAATHSVVLAGYLIVLVLSRPSWQLDLPPRSSQRELPGARWWRRLAGADRTPAGSGISGPAAGAHGQQPAASSTPATEATAAANSGWIAGSGWVGRDAA